MKSVALYSIPSKPDYQPLCCKSAQDHKQKQWIVEEPLEDIVLIFFQFSGIDLIEYLATVMNRVRVIRFGTQAE